MWSTRKALRLIVAWKESRPCVDCNSVYGFAYWLFRYSGLPQRIEQAGYQAGLEAAAQIADHFANDALSPSEYPPQGVTDSRDRGDFGYIKKVSECVAAAIRQLKE